MLRVASLFSGIGGFELALPAQDFRTVLQCEIDPCAREVLRSRFPEVPVATEIKNLKRLPDCDVVTAGFPCQNLSMVGDKTGIGGAKSEIVSHLFRLLRSTRPPWVIVENVRFMLWLRGGEAMAELVNEFERLGYAWAYRVLDSRWFGVPQRRKRVYLVASRTANPQEVIFAEDGGEYDEPFATEGGLPIGFYWTEGNSGFGGTHDAIPTLKAGSGVGIASPPAVLFPDGEVRIPSICDVESMQGFPRNWTEAANIIDTRSRWKLVGNAVTIGVVEWIGKQLLRPRSPDVLSKSTPLDASTRWPPAAYGSAGARFQIPISDRPSNTEPSRLSELDCSTWQPISKRAIDGFISRAQRGRLTFPGGFIDALMAYSERQPALRKAST